jgi:hypothetical protein
MRGNTDPRQQAKSDPLLTPILETPEELRAAYRRRRDEFDYQKIHPADEAKYVVDGWEPHRLLQSALWIKKAKTPDRRLKERVWSLFCLGPLRAPKAILIGRKLCRH